MNGVGSIDLQLWQLAAAYIFILLLIVIVRIKGIEREKEILISSIRMTIQLVLVGYILAYVFDQRHPFYTIIIIAIMLIFAIYNIFKRTKSPLSVEIKRIIALSMAAGILASLTYFILVVLQVFPWYEPRYVIPIAGMIIGNAMTGISLGVNTLLEGMTSNKHLVESALMLGATPKAASKQIVNQAFDAAMLPTINSMVGMGIVFLPGMMTGQILGGASPIVAIEYQIAVMLGIVGSVSLTVLVFVQFGYKTFFNSRSQMKISIGNHKRN
ncbi:iron export ABC transporter permease subunit FetB [Microaerobacter geothermalis]|uniref:ABC transporter permease n=1 Tax=Microaerobacter geothermalis TaxID=674972 RepID=UPI001F401CF1|nr:iron export ABC transporter permease subunit FetB [Microaerobacter geothermalis]MCF6094357.1 iron export ABC transporter permease subunit FetB [Microaerobacter geothermalis]